MQTYGRQVALYNGSSFSIVSYYKENYVDENGVIWNDDTMLKENNSQQIEAIRQMYAEQTSSQLKLIKEQMQTTSENVLKMRQEELGAANKEQVSKIVDPLQQTIKQMNEVLKDSKEKQQEAKMKQKSKRLRALILLFLISYVSYIFVVQEIECQKYKELKVSYTEQIKLAKAKTIEYKEYAEYIKSDEYIEKIAREKLNIVYPEEKIYIEINN